MNELLLTAVEFGFRMAERGHNLDYALAKAKHQFDSDPRTDPLPRSERVCLYCRLGFPRDRRDGDRYVHPEGNGFVFCWENNQ